MHVHGVNDGGGSGGLLRRVVASSALPAPRFRYSPVVAAGSFVFVSGLVGLDATTGRLASGGAESEATQILVNLKALLAEQGWSLGNVVVARIFCSDFAAFPEINRAWEACFDGEVPPARTSVGVSALPLGALVEMEFQLVVALPLDESHG